MKRGERSVCGICGFISQKEISVDILKKMNSTMIHRGPDDDGEELFFSAGRYVGLAHRRLSIIDLSKYGHQPMQSHDKSVSLIYNGEIYNYDELKQHLDYPFTSKSDTEVIIAAYLKWGIDCLSRLNGMFAFALYDHRDDTLYLAKDRIGKKPLYFYAENGDIVFASELKPIMTYPGFKKEIKKDILPRYLCHGYINAPDTIFENTWKLEPGHFLRVKNGQIDDKTWWDLVAVYHEKRKQQVTDYQEAKEEVKARLLQATRMRMVADVPLGMFLSGGYDSTLVTALAQSITGNPVKTYCIGFSEDEQNEAPYAKEVAKHLGTDHTEAYITEEEMLKMVSGIAKYYDEPFADPSQIPMMLVSELARRSVTVALSGDAGDEFFCGYNRYSLMKIAQMLDIPSVIINTIGKIPIGREKSLLDTLPFMIRAIAQNRDREIKTQFAKQGFVEAIRKIAVKGLPELYPIESSLREPSWQRRHMLLDMTHYLPGDGLCKVDRASMKYSLEVRCPILDVDVVEYSFSLRHDFKYKRGRKKRILKDLTYEYVPKELLDRPKAGFNVPLDKWLRSPLREKLIAYTSADMLKKQGLFTPDETQRFVDGYLAGKDGSYRSGDNYSKLVWHLFVFQQWYDEYMS